MAISFKRNFRIQQVDKTWVFIVDTSNETNSMSITNSAEEVVKELLQFYPDRRIAYSDTEGDIWELVHDGKKFISFNSPNKQLNLCRLND
jgi:hypothetical protein